jgi:predicted methyltransferase
MNVVHTNKPPAARPRGETGDGIMGLRIALSLSLVALMGLGCGGQVPTASAPSEVPASAGVEVVTVASPRAVAVVQASDRLDADRKLDAGRHPAELLTFLGLGPGARVGELVAGAGYTAELLARAVAPGGVVYAENPRFVLETAQGAWSERLARPAARTIVRVDLELENPFPPEATNLDLVIVNLVYHDTVWLGVDRSRMNRAVFAALRPGGLYAVVDHSARPGTGLADVKTLHRIDEKSVRAEVESAGFAFLKESSFLRNPSDPRDWNDSPAAAGDRRGTSDRFALLFSRP